MTFLTSDTSRTTGSQILHTLERCFRVSDNAFESTNNIAQGRETLFLQGRLLQTRGRDGFSHIWFKIKMLKIPSDAWLSARLRSPRLADGAFESLSLVLNIFLLIIYAGVGAGLGAEPALYKSCSRCI